MRLTRINHIEHHRIFRNFVWPTELPDFARFNLIYGWNGSGKTTLSGLLRYLQTRRALDASEGDCSFTVGGKTHNLAHLEDAHLPPVRVFNCDTVNRIVFEAPNQHLPPVFFLGEESAEKQRHIEALKRQLAELALKRTGLQERAQASSKDFETYCSGQARAIKTLLTIAGGGPYNNYDARMFKEACKRALASGSPSEPLSQQSREQCLTLKDGVAKAKVERVTFAFPDRLDLARKAEKLVSKRVAVRTLDELQSDPRRATWVRQGLEQVDKSGASESCYFCGGPISAERLAALHGHFNDELKKHSSELEGLRSSLSVAIERLNRLTLPDAGLLYSHLIEGYQSATKVIEAEAASAELFLQGLREVLQRKIDAPLDLIDFQVEFSRAVSGHSNSELVSQLLQTALTDASEQSDDVGSSALAALGRILADHNTYCDNLLEESRKAQKALEADAVMAALPDFRTKSEMSHELETQVLEIVREEAKCGAAIAELERDVLRHQKPAEEMNRDMAAYLGRNEIRFEAKDAGYLITRAGYPAMNLSEGERTAIAFMYFLKSLQDTGFDVAKGIVVIDDPVSSLDANSLFSAFGFMKERTKNSLQLFVLTHSFTFFRQVRNWFHKLPNQQKKDIALRPARFYMVTNGYANGERFAKLAPLDPLLEEFESEYQFLFKRVHEESLRPSGSASLETYYGLPNIARRLLEAFLAFRFPNTSGDLYGRLELVSFDPIRKTRLLRFLHNHSHFDQIADPEHDLTLLSEAPTILQDLMALIEAEDPRHFAGMKLAVHGSP